MATEIIYAGFWRRFSSQIVDIIILSPFMFLAYFFYNVRSYYYIMVIPGLLIGLFFHVYLVQRYGGTPGKRILKIEIRKLDLSKITVKEAFLRYSVLLGLSIIQQIGAVMAIDAITDQELSSLNYMQFATRLNELTPKFGYYATMMMGIWVWGEVIVILFNKKKRAPHDYMAGTVVVESKSLSAPSVPQA